ncbi:MAG: NUDIX hydrolase [Anaerolineae bacterium]|nr:NUDIX hydrolase [Anaerolineae bacterium]
MQEYPSPSVTADVVVWLVRENQPYILLIRRRHDPYGGYWALPGGFVEITETCLQAAQRELFEETGVMNVPLEPLRWFDAPDRDPRKRVITMAYLALLRPRDAEVLVRAGDDAADARWWPLSALPPLAFDHGQILTVARAHLRRRLLGEDLGSRLLPEVFTARELRCAFSAALGESIRARSVLRLLCAAGVVERLGRGRYRYISPSGGVWPYW